MAITGGFGMMMDLTRGGAMRRWVIGRDGVKRWLDDGTPVDPPCDYGACGDRNPGSSDNPERKALAQQDNPRSNGD
ncbi:MAG: hypothetical protein LCH90_17170 [Proteobacteria bacterium]|nr:hypothetical protein [Pseudomonadota bacterium]